MAERLTVAQEVAGSKPVGHPKNVHAPFMAISSGLKAVVGATAFTILFSTYTCAPTCRISPRCSSGVGVFTSSAMVPSNSAARVRWFYDPVQVRLDRLRERCATFGGLVQDYLAALTTDEQIHCSTIEWVEQDV